MASKDKKGTKYYDVTKERRASSWEITLISAAIGATLGFFTAILVGACSKSATLDSILLVSLLATVVGFLLGLLAAWLYQTYFYDLLGQVTAPRPTAPPALAEPSNPSVSETPDSQATAEDKGAAVDYVFPEFSPDQR